jgi:hypothetical protein
MKVSWQDCDKSQTVALSPSSSTEGSGWACPGYCREGNHCPWLALSPQVLSAGWEGGAGGAGGEGPQAKGP